MTNIKEITISESSNKQRRMVVKHTAVRNRKNRKGEPYIISETMHKSNKQKDKK